MFFLIIFCIGLLFFILKVQGDVTELRREVMTLRRQKAGDTAVPLASTAQTTATAAVDTVVSAPRVTPSFVPKAAAEAAALRAELGLGSDPVSYQPATPLVHEPARDSALIAWIKEEFFLKMGGLLVLIAIGWFLSYAFMYNWIGPELRILMGVVAGTVVMALGVWRARYMAIQGHLLVGLGATTMLLTIFAARYIYDFFTPGSALLMMAGVVIVTALIAVYGRSVPLAVAALMGGAAAPLLAHTSNPDALGLYFYLTLLFVGALAVTAALRDRVLVLLSLIVAVLYGLPFLGGPDELLVLAMTFFHALLFFFFSTVAYVRSSERRDETPFLLTLGGIALWLIIVIAEVVVPGWQVLAYMGWGIIFMGGGWLVVNAKYNQTVAIGYFALAGTFAALATTAAFDGPQLIVAFLTEITLVVLGVRLFLQKPVLACRLTWLYGIVVVLSLPHLIAASWEVGIWHIDFLILSLIAVTTGGVAYLLRTTKDEIEPTVLGVTSALYGLSLVWLSIHALLGDVFGSNTTLFALIVMVTLVVLGVLYGLRDVERATLFSWLYALPVAFSLPLLASSRWETGIFHLDCYLLILIMVVLGGMAYLLRGTKDTLTLQLLVTASAVYGLALIWLVSHAWFGDTVGTALSLITYTVLGLGLYQGGRATNDRYARVFGAVLVTGVLLRLFLIDVWQLDLALRIIAFFVIGVLFIIAALMRRDRAAE